MLTADCKKDVVFSFYKAIRSFGKSSPMLLGVILLLGLFRTYISTKRISAVFTGDLIGDTVMGSMAGSISTGNAAVGYIIGGELFQEHISLVAVTSFIAAWVTVGIIQLPAEAAILGKRFAYIRIVLSYILAILVSIFSVQTLMMIQ